MKKLKDILLYLWQLPQNLVGFVLKQIYPAEIKHRVNGNVVYINRKFRSGISLGRYIILKWDDPIDIRHELGHCKQSRRWSWAYLFVPGLCSIVHNMHRTWKNKRGKPVCDYYHYWVEAQADRLGGVKRK